ncbi:MAG: FtsK/SpoIIIE domain-containing protein [Anaerolineae bacterium]
MAVDLYTLMPSVAAQVIKTLRERGAPVELDNPKGKALARVGLIEIYLKPQSGTKVSQVMALSDDIALAVRNDHARLTQSDGKLIVQIPYGARQKIAIESLYDTPRQPYTAMLGCDLYGKPVGVTLTDPATPHVLVAGTTGSGKTALAQSMVMSLVKQHPRSELMLVVIDPKAERPAWFESAIAGHLGPPVSRTPEESIKALRQVVRHMENVSESMTQLVVYVDEAADLIMAGGGEAQELLTRIAQRGRSAGIHLIIGTQKPSAKHLGPLLTTNLPLRLAGRVVNASDSALACGQAGCGAEKLLGGGDFLMVNGSQVTRFQAAIPAEYASGAKSFSAPDWTAPTETPTLELPSPDDGNAGKLLDAQALAIYWYRRANPKTIYTKTELARILWPGMKTLAGGYSSRIEAVIAQADRISTENLPT